MSDLPLRIEDGLLLRWANEADIEALVDFNATLHADSPGEPSETIRAWVYDLVNGRHPTTSASDFTVVIDQNDGGKIVSSLNLISQRWQLEDIEFGVGRPELVGTLEPYRRRGLVRYQMNAVHDKSTARGELVQAITGIPWYYRQFGYEMTVDMSGGQNFTWTHSQNDLEKIETPYRVRAATQADVPLLLELYSAHCRHALLRRVRDATVCEFEGFEASDLSPYSRNFYIIETAGSKTAVGYFEYKQWGSFVIREFGVRLGVSWRPAIFAALQHLKEATRALNKERETPIGHATFILGQTHPVYDALGEQLDKPFRPYAYYIRVPDIVAFLKHISSVLERRLAGSVLAGHSGTHRLSFFRSNVELVLENGRLSQIAPYPPKNFDDGHAFFPEYTFLHLLFGYLSLDELKAAYADCSTRDAETAVLLDILFPKRPSRVTPLG